MSGDNLTRVVEDLQRDGIHRFDSSLSVDLCHSLERFARETPALLRHGCEDSAGKPERAIYSRSDPLCTRYDFEETDLLKQAVVQETESLHRPLKRRSRIKPKKTHGDNDQT